METIVAIKLRRSIFNQTNNLRIPGSLQIIVQNEKRGNISNEFYKICNQRHSLLFSSNQVKEPLCQQHNFYPILGTKNKVVRKTRVEQSGCRL